MRVAFTRTFTMPADPALRLAIQNAADADSNFAAAERDFGRATTRLRNALAVDDSVSPLAKEASIKAARADLSRANEIYMALLWRSLLMNAKADEANAKARQGPL